MTFLVSADELAAELWSEKPPRVLDVRWRLDKPDGRDDYRDGHIPDAVYVDLDHELASHGDPRDGRHPLPSEAEFQATVRAWGINDGDRVVVYDDLKNLSAARAWWMLRYAGIADVRLLDGSLRAWTDAGHPLETGEVQPQPGSAVLRYGALPTIEMDEAAALPERGILIDARAGERYRGEVEPVDPRAGHIPGAVNAPTAENVDASGQFLPAEVLRARFEALGVSSDGAVGVYCGSGVTAAHEVAALAIAGFDAALYPGSWSQWSNHPDRPVETGEGAN
ncbi:MAG: sulfurtransferase [Rhodoglobus sp.]